MSAQAFFIGDHAALDFLNSIAAPRGEEIEAIADGAAYLRWLVDAGLLRPAEKVSLEAKFGKIALDRVAAEARELREWFRRMIETSGSSNARRFGSPQRAEIVATLNQILSGASRHRQLEIDEKRLVLREQPAFTKAGQLLLPVAEALAELMTVTDQALIKRCANPNCTMWFYDRTKAHRRLFCSAAVCGNRAKVAAFRERQRAAK